VHTYKRNDNRFIPVSKLIVTNIRVWRNTYESTRQSLAISGEPL